MRVSLKCFAVLDGAIFNSRTHILPNVCDEIVWERVLDEFNDKLLECLAKHDCACRDDLVGVIQNVQDRVRHLTNNRGCLHVRMVIGREQSMTKVDRQTEGF